MTFLSYGISLPCCTSSSPLALVVCGICLVACDTLLCAAQRGNVFPSCFCFFAIIIANLSRQIYQDSVINPTILPTFFAKEPLFAVFFYTIAEIFCPVPCPTEVWCPIHHCAYPGVMPQHRYGDGMRCLMTRPTVRQKTQRAAWAYAARCDGKCNALHEHMHRTAFSGAELRGLDCSGPRV